MQIVDKVSITQNTWTQLTALPSQPSVVFLSASGDFRVGYGDAEPVDNWMHVELLGQMPFGFSVQDPSKLWVLSTSATAGDRNIGALLYRKGEGIIPYC
jgi:hypothetical protein